MSIAVLLVAGCAPGTDAPLLGGDLRLSSDGIRSCPDPQARSVRPFTRTVVGADWPRESDPVAGGRGVVVADLDRDGTLDLFVPRFGSSSRVLFGAPGKGFADRTETALATGIQDAFGASAADVDGDGDLDVMVYRARTPAALLINDGTGTFAIEHHEDWEPDYYGCGGAAAWADLDLDGDLDLLYGRLGWYDQSTEPSTYFPCRSPLLINDGTGQFTDAGDQLGEDVQHLRVMAAGWHQIDDDPWPELYVVTDLPEFLDGARLLDNDGGILTQLDGTGTEVDLAGMGIGAGDLNDDGITDFVVPGIDEIAVLQSSEDGRWIDWSSARGLVPDRARGQSVGWGGELADLDNDGEIDIVMAFGSIPQSSVAQQPDEIYRNLGDGGFEPVGADWGFDDTFWTRGFVVADLDGNGWLDVVKREFGGPVVVHTAACGANHWLGVRLALPTGNRDAVGARVEVEVDGRILWRSVGAGSTNYNSAGPPEVHFGLGDAPRIDALTVHWPDGHVTHHPDLDADQWIRVDYAPDP